MHAVNVGIRVMSLACLVVLFAGTAQTQETRTPLRVITRKPDDRVTVQLQGDRALCTVLSPSGIGGATITREGERWAGSMVIRLRLRGMERLRVGNGKVTLSASVSSSGGHRTSLSLSEKGKMESPIDGSSPFWSEVRILDDQGQVAKDLPLKDGVFEVTLPHALFVSSPSTITLDWIDFHR